MVPLLGLHVVVNRAVPVAVDGGSSGIGLGYVAHGFARSPIFWNFFYMLFVATSVWHLVGGWAAWNGLRVTTARTERGHSAKSGILEKMESREEAQRKRRTKWIVHGIAALCTAIWLAGGLGIVAHGGQASGWEAKNWDQLYKSVPIVGDWL
jgi:tRNA (guanine26-N2/guanine27-N2)-dimethyltransferase